MQISAGRHSKKQSEDHDQNIRQTSSESRQAPTGGAPVEGRKLGLRLCVDDRSAVLGFLDDSCRIVGLDLCESCGAFACGATLSSSHLAILSLSVCGSR